MSSTRNCLHGLGACAALAAAALFAPGAHATLIGDTVSCDVSPAIWSCDAPTAVVGGGTEFVVTIVGDSVNFDIDLGASSITMTNTGPNGLGAGAGELLTLGDLDFDLPAVIVGIANFVTAGTSGMDIGDVTFGSDFVVIDFDQGAQWDVGSFISFDLVTRRVPEPATVLLLGLGLMTLGRVGRRA